jgi:hypothetical protein
VTATPVQPPDWTFLVAEIDAAASLLRRARELWLGYSFALLDAEPLMVLLATGCEKLLKLTYGLAHADVAGAWPPYAVFKKYGHDLAGLDRDCRALITDRLDRATHPGVISPLLDAVGDDAHLQQLLDTLTAYAKRGRFYNLDHLAGSPQDSDPPARMWDQLVDAAFFSRPDLQPLLGQDNESWTRLRRETNQMLVDSLSTWQELYARAWAHGVCGAEAKRFGLGLLPTRTP